MKRISSIAILLAIVFQVALASFQVNVATTGAPTPKLYQRTAYLPISKKVFVHGGSATSASTDTHLFDPTTKVFTAITPDNVPRLFAHTIVADPDDNVYFFGGNNGTARTNALKKCSISIAGNFCEEIFSPASGGTGYPGVRTLSTIVYYKNTLVLFGGGNSPIFHNDVWQYDLTTNTWTNRVPQGAAGGPVGRTAGCVALYGDELIVSGGSITSPSPTVYVHDAWILNLTTWTWTNVTATMRPSVPHSDAACAVIGDHLLIYGGNTAGGATTKILDMAHIPSRTWLAAYTNTNGVGKFGFPQAVVDGVWYIFGGDASTGSTNSLDIYTPDEPEYTIGETSTDPNTENTENTDSASVTVTVTVTVTETASTENTDTNLPTASTENTETPSSTQDTSITGVIPTENPTQNTNPNTNTNTDDGDSSSVAVVASAVLVVCMSVLAL